MDPHYSLVEVLEEDADLLEQVYQKYQPSGCLSTESTIPPYYRYRLLYLFEKIRSKVTLEKFVLSLNSGLSESAKVFMSHIEFLFAFYLEYFFTSIFDKNNPGVDPYFDHKYRRLTDLQYYGLSFIYSDEDFVEERTICSNLFNTFKLTESSMHQMYRVGNRSGPKGARGCLNDFDSEA